METSWYLIVNLVIETFDLDWDRSWRDIHWLLWYSNLCSPFRCRSSGISPYGKPFYAIEGDTVTFFYIPDHQAGHMAGQHQAALLISARISPTKLWVMTKRQRTGWAMSFWLDVLGCSWWVWVNTYRCIFRGMNIHLPAILMFTRGTRFWHTAISLRCSRLLTTKPWTWPRSSLMGWTCRRRRQVVCSS